MGKIISNGNVYSGCGDYASKIKFDHSSTSLAANNVQSALVEVDNNITECYNNLTSDIETINTKIKDTGNSISLDIDEESWVMTLSLLNEDGEVIDSKEIDFPIESAIVNASYDEDTKKLTFTLQSGVEINVPIGDIINGLTPNSRTIAGVNLVDDITKEELNTALGVDTLSNTLSTHTSNTTSHVTASERSTWNKNTTDISTLNTDLINNSYGEQSGSNNVFVSQKNATLSSNGLTLEIIGNHFKISGTNTTGWSTFTLPSPFLLKSGMYIGSNSSSFNANFVLRSLANTNCDITMNKNTPYTLSENRTFNQIVMSAIPMNTQVTYEGDFMLNVGSVALPYEEYFSSNKQLGNSVSSLNENTTKLNTDLTDLTSSVAVNLFNSTLKSLKEMNTSGTWSGNVYTKDGMTVTVNSDLSLKFVGKATPSWGVYFYTKHIDLKIGNYTFSCLNSNNNIYGFLARPNAQTLNVKGSTSTFSVAEDITSNDIGIICNYNVDINTTVYPMIERGTVAHPYQPCIGADSIPKSISNTNTQLSDYKLNSVFDGRFKLGAYSSTGVYSETDNRYTSINPMSVVAGSIVKAIYPKTIKSIIFNYFNGSTFLSRVIYNNVSVATDNAPTNATICYVTIYNDDLFSNTNKPLRVYVDNSIDTLNENLAKSTITSTNVSSVTVDLSPYRIAEVIVMGVFNTSQVNNTGHFIVYMSSDGTTNYVETVNTHGTVSMSVNSSKIATITCGGYDSVTVRRIL